MRSVQDSRISYKDGKYLANCVKCGNQLVSNYKCSIVRTLRNGHCIKCLQHYRKADVPQNKDGKWISHCPKCKAEQAYTRPAHARASERLGWVCRKCRDSSKSSPVGNEKRLFNKFSNSATTRGIPWKLKLKDFMACYDGTCALTGWRLDMSPKTCTASLDRIDSSKPYEVGNIQWVHKIVNIAKNTYSQEQFIDMCISVAKRVEEDEKGSME